ncbi:MAG: hypothetical protein AAGE52_01720 [Myxococcota bacterium]
MRKPLSSQGGSVRTAGDETLSKELAKALARSSEERDTLTHGFHSYPARMHPSIANEILSGHEDGLVVDPFCGSGTVLVEARVAGHRALGVDLSPLAVWIAEAKTDVRSDAYRASFRALVRSIGERSEERVRSRVDARAPIPKSELRWWGPHVLKELAGLREEILDVSDRPNRRMLGMVFSSILVKVSKQRSDTAMREETKRIRKGLSTEFFVRKGLELADRWEALAEATGRSSPRPTIREGDALELKRFVPKGAKASLILASPPYGGTYDYVDHHARRYAWLDLDARKLERGEIGARRHFQDERDEARWDRQVVQMLRAMEAVLAKDGRIVLLVGDGQIGSRRVDAIGQLRRLAPRARLEARAAASQLRPDFTGGKKRREHLILLTR